MIKKALVILLFFSSTLTNVNAEVISYIDNMLVESNPQLSSIRTESINREIRRTECLADIIYSNGNSTAISYDAQYTDEEDIYVTVYGLN